MPKQAKPETIGQGDLLDTASAMPPTVARIVRAAETIADEAPRRADFLHSVLCQVGLPRKRVDGHTFERTSGNVSLLLEAGKLWNGSAGSSSRCPMAPAHGLPWSTSAARPCAPDPL
jgi:hypothetical protein